MRRNAITIWNHKVDVSSDSRDFGVTVECVQLDVLNPNTRHSAARVHIDKGADVSEPLDCAIPLRTAGGVETLVYEAVGVLEELDVPPVVAGQSERFERQLRFTAKMACRVSRPRVLLQLPRDIVPKLKTVSSVDRLRWGMPMA